MVRLPLLELLEELLVALQQVRLAQGRSQLASPFGIGHGFFSGSRLRSQALFHKLVNGLGSEIVCTPIRVSVKSVQHDLPGWQIVVAN